MHDFSLFDFCIFFQDMPQTVSETGRELNLSDSDEESEANNEMVNLLRFFIQIFHFSILMLVCFRICHKWLVRRLDIRHSTESCGPVELDIRDSTERFGLFEMKTEESEAKINEKVNLPRFFFINFHFWVLMLVCSQKSGNSKGPMRSISQASTTSFSPSGWEEMINAPKAHVENVDKKQFDEVERPGENLVRAISQESTISYSSLIGGK